jgi:hypothetical protein
MLYHVAIKDDTRDLQSEEGVESCNFLSSAFKKALQDGDYEEAIALYGSGNVNLRTPFPSISKATGQWKQEEFQNYRAGKGQENSSVCTRWRF